MKFTLLMTFCLIPFAVSMVACKPKGPAEEAGEKVDSAVESLKDAVDPKGPVEKTGEKIDKALGN